MSFSILFYDYFLAYVTTQKNEKTPNIVEVLFVYIYIYIYIRSKNNSATSTLSPSKIRDLNTSPFS